MSTFHEAETFGREMEFKQIEDALIDPSLKGIVIEGEMGIGKTYLASEIHCRRGGKDLWIRGDRVMKSVEFGALGLIVDLDQDPESHLRRTVAALSEHGAKAVIFADDVHELDSKTLAVLWQLVNEGEIRLVATARPSFRVEGLPFTDLVADNILDSLHLEPRGNVEFTRMLEHRLGGILSRGVIDIVDFHSGRVPGKVIELLGYTSRENRLIERNGTWLLDGLNTDFDERARDVTRIELARYTREECEALEIVVLAGEIEVELMLSVGLGEAADALVRVGDLKLEQRSSLVYVTDENHATETTRFTVPIGRSRQMYETVSGYDDSPTDRSRMLRADWALRCGARISVQETIDTARIAVRLGEWQRALLILSEVPTDSMTAHELFDLGRLYCDVNRAPIGLDILAQAVQKACCPSVVIEALVVWIYRDMGRTSPPLNISDFHIALDRLETVAPAHAETGIRVGRAKKILDLVEADYLKALPDDEELIRQWVRDSELPGSLRMSIAAAYAERRIIQGRSGEALEMLAEIDDFARHENTTSFVIDVIRTRALLQTGRVEETKNALKDRYSNDIAYLAARSGPRDLVWTRVHLEDNAAEDAAKTSYAAVEGLDFWNQRHFLAIALAQAEYMAMLNGDVEAADEYDARYDSLPSSGSYVERGRATVLRLVSRAKITGDAIHIDSLREFLQQLESNGDLELAALIRIELFRHFGEAEPDVLRRLGRASGDRDFIILAELGAALADRDAAALGAFADSVAAFMPDMADRCRRLARSYAHANGGGPGGAAVMPAQPSDLTGREKQVSRLIIAGLTNSEIAAELGVAVRTVEGHTYRMYRKLDISSRDQVAEALGRLQINL